MLDVERRGYTSRIMVESPPPEDVKGKYHFETGYLPLSTIIVLPQARKTFEDIETLAQNIDEHRQLNPMIVARFDLPNWQSYIDFLNRFWRTNIDLADTKSVIENGEEFFYVLLAGERRYRACQLINKQYVFATACINIPPVTALRLQASENIHMPVPPHEEARFYTDLFNFSKAEDPKYTLAQFSRDVGRSEEKIRKSLYFCDLPLKIQHYVEQFYEDRKNGKKTRSGIPFAFAVEITRLQREVSASEDELSHWAKVAMTGNYRLPEFRDLVSKYLLDLKYGQTMLGLFTQAQERVFKQTFFKRVVAKELLPTIWERIAYLGQVGKLYDDGLLGKEDSPFSIKSPVRVYRSFVSEVEAYLPRFWNLLPRQKRVEARNKLLAAGVMLEFLEEEASDDTENGSSALVSEIEQLFTNGSRKAITTSALAN